MKRYHKNPRQITDRQYNDLRRWLRELGDLSGIIHNLETDEIVGGNQRGRVFGLFDLSDCEVVVTQEFDEPDEQGTAALGYVIWQGKPYSYRQVRWDERTAEQANIVANRAGGEWDFDILANEWDVGDLLDWGFTEHDFEMQGWELGGDGDAPEDPGPQIDKAAELQEKWQVQRGQVWEIASKTAVGTPYIVCDCGCEIEL